MWLVYIIAGHFIVGFISAITLYLFGYLANEKPTEILIMTLYGYVSFGLLLGCLCLDIEEWMRNRK